MELTFLGATKTVTGSKYLINYEGREILIDCGLFQGFKELRLRNWEDLPLDVHKINAVLLTHAHIDHSGYLPALIRQRFHSTIYCTHGTKALCSVLLPDSGRLQEEEAYFANKHGFTKHKPALPLYTKFEAENTLRYFQSFDFNQSFSPTDNITATFKRSGHIIGAALTELRYRNKTILFTGDLGRMNDPVMKPPVEIKTVDYLVIESTYGDRLHEKNHPTNYLAAIINQTMQRGGVLVVPAFAVGRTQSLMYYIMLLKREKKIPDVPVYLDSPMATNATKIFCQYADEHRLGEKECKIMCEEVIYITTPEQSKALDKMHKPMIIISASGMLTGGRVLHHMKQFGTDPRNTVLFTGYQADGTRGEMLEKGEREIKIHGESVTVTAQIASISSLSAHADQEEILEWCRNFTYQPKKVFITHGELSAALHLKQQLETKLGWNCVIPEYLQKETLV
jgi:metallo-beta-lactamase family protein